MRLCFATNNPNKLSEVQSLLNGVFEIVGLKDIGCSEDIPETADTIEGNSLLKAQYVASRYKIACFADDTGLEVNSLGGEPGVYSARYAGLPVDGQKNINKLLSNLSSQTDRSARFKTVITLILNGQIKQFEGIVQGQITKELQGTGGFGYDPIFVPQGYQVTFAEMSKEEKNRISHRGLAVEKLVNHLKSITD